MSVTFRAIYENAEGVLVGACTGHRYTCDCDEHAAYFYCDHVHERTMAAEDACDACSLEVNVSNANAALLLERLGVEFDYCGTVDASDFLARAMLANVGRDDSGTATVTDSGGGGATMVDCGLRPGYYGDRFDSLAALATWCAARGYLVGWS